MIYNIASSTRRILHRAWREDIIYECTRCEINYRICKLNCRILDSRLIYHDEDTLTGSECVAGEYTDTVTKLKAQ